MKTKFLRLTVLSTVAALIILSPSAFAATSTPLNLTLNGVIANAGSQLYILRGGQLNSGEIGGQAIATGTVNYGLVALVNGLNTHGLASLSVSGTTSGGSSISVRAIILINNEIAAGIFPLNPTTFTNCDPTVPNSNCNSEIPLLFTGVATITMPGQGKPEQLPIAIESAYWNPFGGPILITSLDSQTAPALSLVVTYTTATISWTGVVLTGTLGGTYGTGLSNPAETVTGSYSTVSFSQEDLLTGTEQDRGTQTFAQMSDPTLNSQGPFQGTTSFSQNAPTNFDCSEGGTGPLTFPILPEGTCTATGATSAGTFNLFGQHSLRIVGSYNTFWSTPSLFTQTVVEATVVSH